MKVQPLGLGPVCLLVPQRFEDARGWLCESWSAPRMAEHGIAETWVQDNISCSTERGTLRGLHFQRGPHAQAKLVQCMAGTIYDVVVDLRAGSDTYAQWAGAELTAERGEQIYVPAGFAHGFVTRAPGTRVHYRCSAFYDPPSEGNLRWDDPELGIDWRLGGPPILSEKDASAPSLSDIQPLSAGRAP